MDGCYDFDAIMAWYQSKRGLVGSNEDEKQITTCSMCLSGTIFTLSPLSASRQHEQRGCHPAVRTR